ncbi:5-enolpyruvylshikimate-3-phosphate synthase [Gossypium australe]|uniref:5-enolpyruvylshikimate-3-phosphate synthase n=1 Tax=Gossypium australe TaxID=47621 RepID=A0A5B6UYP0_9ROSI|nr:5-enolpyruvylshikimate-3-phosphate synthase [Gossypium australe]
MTVTLEKARKAQEIDDRQSNLVFDVPSRNLIIPQSAARSENFIKSIKHQSLLINNNKRTDPQPNHHI